MIKLDQPQDAAALCTQTLDLEPSNKKARLRRGLAYEALSLYAKVCMHTLHTPLPCAGSFAVHI